MSNISRRQLVSSSLAVSCTLLLSQRSWAKTAETLLGSAEDSPATSPSLPGTRERLLFDFGWKFKMGDGVNPVKDLNFGYGQSDFSKTGDFALAKVGYDDSAWQRLDLPHDWAVGLPFEHDDTGKGDQQLRSHGYKPLGRRFPETSVGWYRREFDIPAQDAGRQITLDFDGVFRDSLVFLNGCFIGRNTNGYAPFSFDLTDFLVYGGRNYLVIRVDASYGDGWFYEGAGIYRHVWLNKMDMVHLQQWETVVRSTVRGNSAEVALATLVVNRGNQPAHTALSWEVRAADGKVVARAESPAQTVAADGTAAYSATVRIPRAELWSLQNPHLYTARAMVKTDGTVRDAEDTSFGIRTIAFDADRGFSLNGEPLKIKGTCNHQDHAGVGVALPDALQVFRLNVLRAMGCNAVRTSHNQPTPEWVEACDRAGVMMMCETRQMSSNDEGMQELERMLKQFRNSPSIILWSIGNEEYLLQDKMAEQGARIAASMVRRCHEVDPTRPVSAAVNFDNEKGLSIPLDVVGFNYNTDRYPEPFHKKYPKRPILGSEVSSAISTRGEYTTDPLRNTVNSYDGVVPWGETPEKWWSFYGTKAWEAGGFAWTGFDYRGEPTPYGWPSVNSQFGIVDLCGFPKDYFYYYKTWWRSEPTIHLFPHWNWHGREGDEIPVWVYTNLDEVELFLNGKSLGTQQVPRLKHVEWKVRFEPGTIEARASKGGTVVLTQTRQTTGAPAAIRLGADRTAIHANGQDAAVLTVEVVDEQGRLVPTAKNMVTFKVEGEGKLIGVGNGDPNCQESDKAPRRSVFNGLAQVIVQSTKRSGTIRITAGKEGWGGGGATTTELLLTTTQVSLRPAVAEI